MATKIVTLAELYRLHGRTNVKVCTNGAVYGAVYRRAKESNSWVFVCISEEVIALIGGAK